MLPVIVGDQHPFEGIEDHLANGGMVIYVQPVVVPEGYLHRPFGYPRLYALPPQF